MEIKCRKNPLIKFYNFLVRILNIINIIGSRYNIIIFFLSVKKMDYHIVCFDENAVSLVPDNWMNGNNFVRWPPKNNKDVRLLQKRRVEPSQDWDTYNVKILATGLTFKEARVMERSYSTSCSSSDLSDNESSSESNLDDTEEPNTLKNDKAPNSEKDNYDDDWDSNLTRFQEDAHSKTTQSLFSNDVEEEEDRTEAELQNEKKNTCQHKNCIELQKSTVEQVKNCLIDLTKEIHYLVKGEYVGKKEEIVDNSPRYSTKQDFDKLEHELLNNEEIKVEFSTKLKSIFKYNKNEIGSNVNKFFTIILKALFDTNLLKIMTWKKFKGSIFVKYTEIFKMIQRHGSLVDKIITEYDRYEQLKKALKHLKDTNRKKHSHIGK